MFRDAEGVKMICVGEEIGSREKEPNLWNLFDYYPQILKTLEGVEMKVGNIFWCYEARACVCVMRRKHGFPGPGDDWIERTRWLGQCLDQVLLDPHLNDMRFFCWPELIELDIELTGIAKIEMFGVIEDFFYMLGGDMSRFRMGPWIWPYPLQKSRIRTLTVISDDSEWTSLKPTDVVISEEWIRARNRGLLNERLSRRV
jgi:hypothetical protein